MFYDYMIYGSPLILYVTRNIGGGEEVVYEININGEEFNMGEGAIPKYSIIEEDASACSDNSSWS